MKDLIDRQSAIDALAFGEEMLKCVLDNTDVVGVEREKYAWGLGVIETLIDDIRELSSAQPEIIRCKDCRFFKGDGLECHWGLYAYEGDFCSHGERRETDETD